MRPGRADMTNTLVLMNTASLMLWVMNSPAKPFPAEELLGLLVEVLAGDLVDRAERLVEQEHRWAQRERAGERGTHLHPARQRLGVVVLEPREPHQVDGVLGQSTSFGLGDVVELGEQFDVAHDRAPMQQRGVLEDVPDA